jgi:phenylpyruvate tautomerase PptA (4-oxalocrotonate tautomerase family)
MPWINLTVRRGTFTKERQHAVMAKLTDTLMYWEKVPDTPEARKFMKGWVYEVDEDSDYNGGSPRHKDPFYFIEVRLPAGRFDTLTKLHLIHDFTRIIMLAEGKQYVSEDANRVWVTIIEHQENVVNKSTAAAGPADATNSPTVHLESLDQGAIAVLTLDHPKRANAMSREMGDGRCVHLESACDPGRPGTARRHHPWGRQGFLHRRPSRKDFQSEEYRRRVADYLPKHYE